MVFAEEVRGSRIGGEACSEDNIWAASQAKDTDGEIVYSCQATELRNFTFAMSPLDTAPIFPRLVVGQSF